MNFSSNISTHILTSAETLPGVAVTHNDHPGPVPEAQDAGKVSEGSPTSVFTRVENINDRF